MSYSGYLISLKSRVEILQLWKPKFSTIYAHHCTYEFPSNELPPEVKQALILGYSAIQGIEALVLIINGSTTRPDGNKYHVTLSLNGYDYFKPKDSNKLIQEHGYTALTVPMPIELEPKVFK
jgi:hypothetical protein